MIAVSAANVFAPRRHFCLFVPHAAASCFYLPVIFTRLKGFGGEAGLAGQGRFLSQRGATVQNSILKVQKSTAVTGLAAITKGVEYGFFAAGVTVAGIAAVQSLSIVLNWIASRG